jgi:hypothetical protein
LLNPRPDSGRRCGAAKLKFIDGHPQEGKMRRILIFP